MIVLSETEAYTLNVPSDTNSTLFQSTAGPSESTANLFTTNWDNTKGLNDSNMPGLSDTDDELNDDGIFNQVLMMMNLILQIWKVLMMFLKLHL